MRRAELSLVVLALLWGCSFLEVHSYYVPSAPGGEPRKDVVSRCGGNDGYSVSGPAPRIAVRSDEVVLGIQAGVYRVTTLAAGPLSLPIIPAFPPSFFPHSALEAGDVLPIDFRILEPRDEEVDFSGAIVKVFSRSSDLSVTSADASVDSRQPLGADLQTSEPPSFVASDISQELVTFEGWTPVWDLSDGWTLSLRIGPGDPAPFRLSVRGLLFRGKAVDFPEVEFTPTRGWIVCEKM